MKPNLRVIHKNDRIPLDKGELMIIEVEEAYNVLLEIFSKLPLAEHERAVHALTVVESYHYVEGFTRLAGLPVVVALGQRMEDEGADDEPEDDPAEEEN